MPHGVHTSQLPLDIIHHTPIWVLPRDVKWYGGCHNAIAVSYHPSLAGTPSFGFWWTFDVLHVSTFISGGCQRCHKALSNDTTKSEKCA